MINETALRQIEVKPEDENLRIDIFLSKNFDELTRAKVQKLIASSNVYLLNNDKKIGISSNTYKVKKGQEFLVNIELEKPFIIEPKEIPLDIIYEDEDVIVINKKAGLVVHPGAGNYSDTLVNALVFKYKENLSLLNGSLRAGIVHRLDKDTSGLLVIAKNDYSHSSLAKQFEDHSVNRGYRALVWGLPKSHGIIDTYIRRSENNRQKMEVNKLNKGKRAITNYKIIATNNLLSLIELKLETGRTHQIRVHMAHLGYSLVGDPLYGKKSNQIYKQLPQDVQVKIDSLKRQALHAFKLGFMHPRSKEEVLFLQKEPQDLLEIYNLLFPNINLDNNS